MPAKLSQAVALLLDWKPVVWSTREEYFARLACRLKQRGIRTVFVCPEDFPELRSRFEAELVVSPLGSAADHVSLGELLAGSDIVTLHLPLTADTHHFIGHDQINAMKRGAILVNTGRGALVDTGALISAATRAGARLAGASIDDLEACTRFAQAYGVAFQIADDLKDEIAPEAVSGKRRGGDRAAGKMTYPALFGIEGSRARLREELDVALAALAPLGLRGAALEALAHDSVALAFDDHGATV